ncbi:hypothetical protein [Dethiosulfatarculus sandiegensis]|uniref:Uncharacterized protein n=1 Tax=Dethiosulfatarculus sandiegensis TaxID=1429043 RepID=A0A0D2JQX9_9BACT|nr:hypothetical protein [Dethiosulfatarculus sandiegensis]KIX11900.1 hypothetical protein X474_21785 [Dethiosulfatarculus sandiegensis]
MKIDFLKDWVVPNIPKDFWRFFEEQQTEAFHNAHRTTVNSYEESEYLQLVGHVRHAMSEMAFRNAASQANLLVESLSTNPVGGKYSLAIRGDFQLLRTNIQTHCGPPRPSKFRREYAAYNLWLQPQQLGLWHSPPVFLKDKLCGMILVTRRKKGGDPTVPAYIGLGIPSPDLKSWLGGPYPIQKIIASYSDSGVILLETALKLRQQRLHQTEK